MEDGRSSSSATSSSANRFSSCDCSIVTGTLINLISGSWRAIWRSLANERLLQGKNKSKTWRLGQSRGKSSQFKLLVIPKWAHHMYNSVNVGIGISINCDDRLWHPTFTNFLSFGNSLSASIGADVGLNWQPLIISSFNSVHYCSWRSSKSEHPAKFIKSNCLQKFAKITSR